MDFQSGKQEIKEGWRRQFCFNENPRLIISWALVLGWLTIE